MALPSSLFTGQLVQSAPGKNDWIIGKDKNGKLYLYQSGATDPSGKPASTKGLAQWFNIGSDYPGSSGASATKLSQAISSLGANHDQQQSIASSIDIGAIRQGGKYVAFPVGQKPGQTRVPQGQKVGKGDVVAAGINIPNPFSGLGSGIVQFALRILEMLAGAALIALGLQALTGLGDGSPVTAAKKAVKVVR